MGKWTKQEYRLPKDLGWVCKEGYKSFVADRGAVRLDIPADWTFEAADNSFKFHDAEPPDDTCVLEMSVFYLKASVDWTELSLKQMLADVVSKDEQDVIAHGEVHYRKRGDFEIAWCESRSIDPTEKREARQRFLLARRGLIQALITFAYWPEDAARVLPTWDELLASLRLGEYITMPVVLDQN